MKIKRGGYLNRIEALEYYAYSEYKTVIDDSGSPGLSRAIVGTADAGFLGFVQPHQFPKINGTTDFANDALRSEIGVAGTNEYGDPPWMKFSWDGKILFVPLKPLSRSISWNAIYEAGCVYGSGDEGTLPPNGRIGLQLSIDDTDNSINTSGADFTTAGTVVAAVADTVELKGWTDPANNGTFTVDSIAAGKIVLSGGTLVTEAGGKLSRIYETTKAVDQDTEVIIGGLTYKVRLMRGAADDPTDSYADSDRGSRGDENEWNGLILPLHERAKTGSWNYPAYAPESVPDWGVGLTDGDLITHHTEGNGSYSWCQEARDNADTFRRVFRGNLGASNLLAGLSWYPDSNRGFRPVLELL